MMSKLFSALKIIAVVLVIWAIAGAVLASVMTGCGRFGWYCYDETWEMWPMAMVLIPIIIVIAFFAMDKRR